MRWDQNPTVGGLLAGDTDTESKVGGVTRFPPEFYINLRKNEDA